MSSMVVGVAAVDHDVAPGEVGSKLLERRVDERGRHHQPHDPRRRQLADQVGERRRALRDGAVPDQAFHCGRGPGIAHDPVSAPRPPARHVRAHAPQTYEPEIHSAASPLRCPPVSRPAVCACRPFVSGAPARVARCRPGSRKPTSVPSPRGAVRHREGRPRRQTLVGAHSGRRSIRLWFNRG